LKASWRDESQPGTGRLDGIPANTPALKAGFRRCIVDINYLFCYDNPISFENILLLERVCCEISTKLGMVMVFTVR
jgi:hypothetical protein